MLRRGGENVRVSKIVVKKKGGEPFSEFSFSETSEAQVEKEEETGAQTVEKRVEGIVGVNPLTQKPIIREIKKKPVIRGVIDKTEEEKKEGRGEENELIRDLVGASDVVSQELRRKQLWDIAPVSNEPAVEKRREMSREEAASLARRIWRDQEEKKPFHHRLFRRLGLR
ncbi:MAG: hypothetical protein V1717_00670 [Candidatus Micrarchaeota archaeon]